MNHEDTSFLAACTSEEGHFLCAKEKDGNTESGQIETSFHVYNRSRWGTFSTIVPWAALSLATVEPPPGEKRLIVGVGPHGQLWECLTKPSEETVSRMTSGNRAFLARRLSTVGNTIFAVGMSRRVFARTQQSQWMECGPADPVPGDEAIGFNDMVGSSVDDLYAFGWQGEIYRRQMQTWSRIDSPVSTHFRSAFMASDGTVFAVGYGGTLVRGRDSRWQVIDTGLVDNLQDVCVHGEDVIVCNDYRLFRLTRDGLVPDDRFASEADRPSTCLHLVPGPQGLFSVGPKDLILFADGLWTRIV